MAGALRLAAVLGLALLAGVPIPGEAGAAARALVVGIDHYLPPGAEPVPESGRGEWRNLRGAVHDAEAMAALLAARYGFPAAEVRLLLDEEATREAILRGLREHLVEPSAEGDLAVFYFAGHGSRVANPASPELDRLDETLVPADAWRGAADIRDKEIAALLNDALDRGAQVVAIFDSCNSGSVTRAVAPLAGARFLEPVRVPLPVPEIADARPPPESRGALILSAAQDDQLAREAVDEHGLHHGAFSLALLRALRTAPAADPAERVFRRTAAFLEAGGFDQDPVLAALPGRRAQPLFPGPDRPGSARSGVVAVAALGPARGGRLPLAAGHAAGLAPGSELLRVGDDGAPVRIRVDAVHGPARATARVVEGDPARVRAGDLFELDRWAAPPAARLRLFLPPAAGSSRELTGLARALAAAVRRAGGGLAGPGEGASPVRLARVATGPEVGSWLLAGPGQERQLGVRPRPAALAAALRPGARVEVELPPFSALRDELARLLRRHPGSFELTGPEEADYRLAGTPFGEGLAYRWVSLRGGGDGLSLLPVATGPLPVGLGAEARSALARSLAEQALRLARVQAWLRLEGPPQDGSFPYHLALRNRETGERLAGGVAFVGESFDLVLERNPRADAEQVRRRYAYVFAIDSQGEQTLLFPNDSAGSVENRLPRAEPGGLQLDPVIQLGTRPIRIVPPLGTDVLMLLTTEAPLVDPGVLSGTGVGTRSTGDVPSTRGLLRAMGAGEGRGAPTTWGIERIVLRATAAPTTAPSDEKSR